MFENIGHFFKRIVKEPQKELGSKDAAKERKRQSKNEKLIAKWTGNQRYEDTEENRELAREMAKRKGKENLVFHGDATVQSYQAKLAEEQIDAVDEVADETKKGNKK